MAKPLTPAMAELLQYLRGGGQVHFMRPMRNEEAYYYRVDSQKACTKQVDGLIARGYLNQSGGSVTLAEDTTNNSNNNQESNHG